MKFAFPGSKPLGYVHDSCLMPTFRVGCGHQRTLDNKLFNANFPQAVSTGDVVGFGKRRVVEHSRPEVVDRSPLAHHHLRGDTAAVSDQHGKQQSRTAVASA